MTPRILLGLGVLLSLLALALGVGQFRVSAEEAIASDLEQIARLRTESLQDYFGRAGTVNLMLANNPAFAEFYTDGGREAPLTRSDGDVTHAHRVGDPEALGDVNQALGHLESLFPDSIGEACFIDVRGWENARVVRGEVALPEDLSLDESGAPFFRPTVDLDAGLTHQAKPYVSPDTGEWVVSNSALVRAGNEAPAMVHFEVTLASFGSSGDQGGPYRTQLVDAGSGLVLLDSDLSDGLPPSPYSVPMDRTDFPSPGDFTSLMAGGAMSAVSRIQAVDGSDNANDWMVVVSAAVPSGVGISLDLSAVLLLMIGGVVLLGGLYSLLRGNDALRTQAQTDDLTGILNRRGFIAEVDRMRTQDTAFTGHLMIVGLNRFKQVNDSFGHDTGDQLLCLVGERLDTLIPRDAILARLGGDEFAIAVRSTAQALKDVLDSISQGLDSAFTIDQGPVLIGAAVGVALLTDEVDDVEEGIQRADVAMYHAKRNGRHSAMYDPEMDPNNARRMSLHRRLVDAIATGLLDVHFQPQVDVSTRRVVGLEALARWSDPEEGPIRPDEFIPLAQETGLMPDLTAMVIDRSVQFLGTLDQRLTVSINVSPRSLLDGWVVHMIGDALERWDVAPNRIVVELTEDLLVGDSLAEVAALAELREMGCAVSIDDFGTGHSSLSYLSRLPVDELKIDRSFVENVKDDASMGFILRSTVDLGHNLGLRTVAEGVETEEMLSLVGSLGCDVAQGWLFAAAMPADEAREWIAAQPQASVLLGHQATSGKSVGTAGRCVLNPALGSADV